MYTFYKNMYMQFVCMNANTHILLCKDTPSTYAKLSHFILVSIRCDNTSIVHAVKKMSLVKRHIIVN